MECPFCKSEDLVAGYYGGYDSCVSVEQVKEGDNFLWKEMDSGKEQNPDSIDIQCNCCHSLFKNPL